MNKEPLVSIIVPIYKIEKYLEASLNSIKNQTVSDFECIMIVSKSNDRCMEISQNYATTDERFIILEPDRLGVSHARNMGLDIAKGKYIAFIDGDDIVEPTFLEDLLSNLDENTDMVISKCIREKKYKPCKKKKRYNTRFMSQEEAIDEMICSRIFSGHCTDRLFKRDILGDIRFHEDIHFAEDSVLNFDYLMKCSKVKYIDKVLYHYINHSDSASNAKFNTRQLTCIDAFEYIANNAPSEKIKRSALAWKGALAIMLLYYIKKSRVKDKENYTYLLKVLKDSLPYFKGNRLIKWYIKWFRHFVYFVFKIIK